MSMFGIGPRVRKSTPLLCLPFSPSLFLQFRVNNERAAFGIPSAFTTLTQGLLVASAWSVFYIYVCVCVCRIYMCVVYSRVCVRQCTPGGPSIRRFCRLSSMGATMGAPTCACMHTGFPQDRTNRETTLSGPPLAIIEPW